MGACASRLRVQRLRALTYENTRPFVPRITRAKCVKVYDGDTIHLAYHMDGGCRVRWSCRLRGIDTAELRGTQGAERAMAVAARTYVHDALISRVLYVDVHGTDKYGR